MGIDVVEHCQLEVDATLLSEGHKALSYIGVSDLFTHSQNMHAYL